MAFDEGASPESLRRLGVASQLDRAVAVAYEDGHRVVRSQRRARRQEAAKAAAGARIGFELRDLPESHETYLAHVHPGSCEDEQHAEAPGGQTAHDQHHGNGHRYREHAEEIEYPLTPLKSDARSEGSSTTMLEGVELNEFFSDVPKYLNVHAAGTGDSPRLACADLGKASQSKTS